MNPATGPVAILIGPPGAGKTTVGGLLAARLGVGFADSDALVEAAAGKPVSDIFVEDGEQAFRALERTAAAAVITGAAGPGDAAGGRYVAALGGGSVLDPGTQALLAGRPVVYLETGFAAASRRVGMDRPRPLLIGTNPRAQLKALLEARLPVYARLAAVTVPTDDKDPEQVAADVAAALGP